MHRIHLFELEDFDWIPRSVRDGARLLLLAALSAVGCNHPSPIVPDLPDEPAATEALGVSMPAGTRRVDEMSGAGTEGRSESMVALATSSTEAEALAYFRALPDATDLRPGCVRARGADVCVSAPSEIPLTLFAPVRPIAAAAPGWARAWIRVYRAGAPPPCPPCTAGSAPLPGCSCP